MALPTPVSVADHYLAAIHDRLGELLDRLPEREPGRTQQGAETERGGEVEITEPAPPRPPAKAEPLAEPARPAKRPKAKPAARKPAGRTTRSRTTGQARG